MSLTSRSARRLAAASATSLVALGALAGSAMADTSTTLNYTCTMPIIGDQPITADVTTNIPTTWPANTLTPAFNINVVAHAKGDTYAGLNIIGAKSLSGSAVAASTLTQPNGSKLALKVPITIPNTVMPATDPGAVGVTIPASGSTPKVQFSSAGTAHITVDGLSMSLLAKDSNGAIVTGLGDVADSDKNADTFDLPCVGASVPLADITVTGGTGTPAPTPVPTPVPTPGPTPFPTPTPAPGTINYSYGIAGIASMKTLTTGILNVAGTVSANLALSTGNFTGKVTLANTTGNLKAAYILPVVATIGFLESGTTTGTLVNQTLVANTKQLIRLREIKLFGINLVSNTCVSKTPSAITLKSAAGAFTPLQGGKLTGSFAIAELVNCGALGFVVSPLAAGSGNGIAVTLTKK